MTDINERLLDGMAGRVLVITGSGVSADSGIPTFRGAGGYWRTFKAEELATPEAFARHPDIVWEWYRERRATIAASNPNPAHEALVSLSRFARDFLLVTQNVDNLHERASADGHSLSPSQIVHVHGEIFTTRCTRCDYSRSDHGVPPEKGVPRCPDCSASLRPGVVWFGEQLDPRQIDRVRDFLAGGACDVVLVIGTTALFGYIQQWALTATGGRGVAVEVDPHATALSDNMDHVIRERAAAVLPNLVRAAISRRVPE